MQEKERPEEVARSLCKRAEQFQWPEMAALSHFRAPSNSEMLPLQVLGNAKGVVAALISVAIFRNPVTLTGLAGYAITVVGVVLYHESKKRDKAGQVCGPTFTPSSSPKFFCTTQLWSLVPYQKRDNAGQVCAPPELPLQ